MPGVSTASRIIAKAAKMLRGGELAVDVSRNKKLAQAIAKGRTAVSYRPRGADILVKLDDGAEIAIRPAFTGSTARGARSRMAAARAANPKLSSFDAAKQHAEQSLPFVRTGKGREIQFLRPEAGGGRWVGMRRLLERRTRQALHNKPIQTTGWSAAGGLFFADVLTDSMGGIGQADDRTRRLMNAIADTEEVRLVEQMRAQRTQAYKAINLEILARTQPSVYNAILAGRPLAQDSTVIGGEPNIEFLDQVAQMMAEGRFSPQANPMQQQMANIAEGVI